MSKQSKPPSIAEFCRIVSEASRLKLEGHWHAGAHGYHPRGVIRRPYILTDRWNTNGYCSAHVLTNPNAELERPIDAPASYHNRTFPEPKTGKAICVYDTGRWVADGPWEDALPVLLRELEQEIKKARAVEEAAEKWKRDEITAKREAEMEQARKAAGVQL